MSDTDESKFFHEGIELFNGGEFFEAHEVWEEVWHMASGERKRFYQGLIQCAVTLEHVRRGNPRGVRNVHATAVTKFVGLPEVYMGVRIPRLLGELKRTIQPVLDLPEGSLAPSRGRGAELPVDLGAAPKIVLEYEPFEEGESLGEDRTPRGRGG